MSSDDHELEDRIRTSAGNFIPSPDLTDRIRSTVSVARSHRHRPTGPLVLAAVIVLVGVLTVSTVVLAVRGTSGPRSTNSASTGILPGGHLALSTVPEATGPIVNATTLVSFSFASPTVGFGVVTFAFVHRLDEGTPSVAKVAETTDGGRTWKLFKGSTTSLSAKIPVRHHAEVTMDALGVGVVWWPGAPMSGVVTTDDWGRQWRQLPDATQGIAATTTGKTIWIATLSCGLAMTSECPVTMWTSSDAGVDWRSHSLLGVSESSRSATMPGSLGSLFASGTNIGALFLLDTFLTTSNGWRTSSTYSESQQCNLTALGSTATVQGPKDFWLLCVPGSWTLFRSEDAGRHWRELGKTNEIAPSRKTTRSGHDADATSMTFTSKENGWMTEGTGGLLHTTDGGTHWSQANLPGLQATPSPSSVVFFGTQFGWVLASGAGMWRTTDGGRTWTALTESAAATASAPTCTNGQISVSAGTTEAVMNQPSENIEFVNIGQTACSLTGYPGVGDLMGDGEQVAQSSRTRSVFTGGLEDPGTTLPVVVLLPGQSASAKIGGSSLPLIGDGTCLSFSGFLVTPPNETQSTRIPGTDGSGGTSFLACRGTSVTPVVPGTSGTFSEP